jgi:hypothetical protein
LRDKAVAPDPATVFQVRRNAPLGDVEIGE